MKREFTATVYIVEEGRVLLVYHKKHEKWLPPGGHLEENELPHEGALREALEESGLQIELICQENIWIEPSSNSRSIPRPYLCLLENLPGASPHQHIDLIYVGRPVGGRLQVNHLETGGARWFTLAEVQELTSGVEIFEDTVAVATQLLTPAYVASIASNI